MRFLVCLDETNFSQSILPTAKKFAKEAGAEVELLRVLAPNRASGEPWSGMEAGTATYEARTTAEAAMMPLAAFFEPPARITIVTSASPTEAILRRARSTRPDAILLATHSRGTLAEMSLGSTAREVTRAGVAPVLLLHPTRVKSMNYADIPRGVHAFTEDRTPVGEVIAITDGQIRIRRPDNSHIWISAEAAETITCGHLQLNITASEVDRTAIPIT